MTAATSRAAELNRQRDAFRTFLFARIGDPAEAAHILENELFWAIERADLLQEETSVTDWFYRSLRQAVIDYHRTRADDPRRDDALDALVACLDGQVAVPPDWAHQLGACLDRVLDTFKPRPAELLRRVNYCGVSVQGAARALGMTPNNASVLLQRARKDLRAKLQAFCSACVGNVRLNHNCELVLEKARRA